MAMDINATSGAYNDGALSQAVVQMGKDIAYIKDNMVYRNENQMSREAINQRLSALETSPATMRDWLGVGIAGFGCLGSLALSAIAIIVTVLLFYLRP